MNHVMLHVRIRLIYFFKIVLSQRGKRVVKTIKVVGISGSGKTTLIQRFLIKNPSFSSMSYGDFLVQYGEEADRRWNDTLEKKDGTVIIDDHLEWGDRDFVSLYKAEGTQAILLITAGHENIIRRRSSDVTRERSLDEKTIVAEQAIATRRAHNIAQQLCIPLYLLHDATIDESCVMLEQVVREVG